MSGADSAEWKAACDVEMRALMEQNTFELVQLPAGCKAIKSVWAFKVKEDANGQPVKRKARLCAKGFQQVFGRDFTETFSPVFKFTTFRVAVAIAAQLHLRTFQFDAPSAYLNGTLDHPIYMQQPNGYDDHSGRVWLLRKALYGLKQAGRVWNDELDATLKRIGLRQCVADPCAYVMRRDSGKFLILLVYVDDLYVATNSDELISIVRTALRTSYKVKEVPVVEWILGVHVSEDNLNTDGGIVLDQQTYLHKIVDLFGSPDLRPASTPAIPQHSVVISSKDSSSAQPDQPVLLAPAEVKRYQSLVGALLYLTNGTRPDIAYAVSVACRACKAPSVTDLAAVKRIVQYLTANPRHALFYGDGSGKVEVSGFADASWASDADKFRSVCAYVFFIGGGPVSWKCKLHPTVALSSAEAEYLAIGDAAREALWLRSLLAEFGFPQLSTSISVDSRSAKAIAENPVFHSRTKHINLIHHFIRQYVKTKEVLLVWVPTEQQLADIFTKPLPAPRFFALRDSLMSVVT